MPQDEQLEYLEQPTRKMVPVNVEQINTIADVRNVIRALDMKIDVNEPKMAFAVYLTEEMSLKSVEPVYSVIDQNNLERLRQTAITQGAEPNVGIDEDLRITQGFDSLDMVEFIMAIEEEFDIEIADKDVDAIHKVSVRALYDAVIDV